MSQSPLFPAGAQKSAYIRDDALILYFETAEIPLVARFDLDSLVQANFEVVKKDEVFALVLRDFSGQRQEITTFSNKADAHQALYAILQALLSYGENKKGSSGPSNPLWKFFKGLVIGFVIAVAAAFLLTHFATPANKIPETNATAAKQEAPVPQTEKAASAEAVPQTKPVEIPEGEPMSMDDFVAPAMDALQSAPNAEATTEQTPAAQE